jgi:antitoxin YefM
MNTISLPQTMSVSDARINLYDLISDVSNKLRRFVITHKGQPKAIVMPIEDVEAWEETLDILSNKKLMKDIRQGNADLKAGRGIPIEVVMKSMGI